ncbi:MAG: YHS domain-containing protein [Planctomycetes bacterium]|nr:YHS domain-containing protein [Planctomycetota bacterium]
MAKFARDGVLLESTQKTCPVMGREIKKDIFVDYKGRRVYFCCPACPAKFKADPEKYLKALEKEPESKKEQGSQKEQEDSQEKCGRKMKMDRKSGGCK